MYLLNNLKVKTKCRLIEKNHLYSNIKQIYGPKNWLIICLPIFSDYIVPDEGYYKHIVHTNLDIYIFIIYSI